MPLGRAYESIFSSDRFSFWLAGVLFFSSIIILVFGSLIRLNYDLIGALSGALIAGAATLFGTAIAARQTRLAENERQEKAEAEIEALRGRIRTMIIADVRGICEKFLGLKPFLDHALAYPSSETGMIQIGNIFLKEFHEMPLLAMVKNQVALLGSEEMNRLAEFMRENSLACYDLGWAMPNPGENNPSRAQFARQRISDLLTHGANLIESMRPDEQLRNKDGKLERGVDLLRRVAGSHLT